jgi:hypothetical protein
MLSDVEVSWVVPQRGLDIQELGKAQPCILTRRAKPSSNPTQAQQLLLLLHLQGKILCYCSETLAIIRCHACLRLMCVEQ